MEDSKLVHYPAHNPIRLDNKACVYCGCLFTDVVERTKEHVIGRNFVPRGVLDRQWNLLVNACRSCNEKKARLENDISAITMQPDITGRHPMDDPRLKEAAVRKGMGAISHSTKKPIRDSIENLKISGQLMPGVTAEFDMCAAPQLDQDRAFELAMYHIRAFFYMITYDDGNQRGGYWEGVFMAIMHAQKLDWGNAVMRGFQTLTCMWDYRVIAISASEFFKAAIRRSPDSRPLWSWALEWNGNYRLIGFFGDEAAARDACKQLPSLHVSRINTGPNSYVTVRPDVPLVPAEDTLFMPPPAAGN